LSAISLTTVPSHRSNKDYNGFMRLLVIEDEPDLLSILARSLREYGYAVDTSVDGVDGLHKAKAWEYDAIVLDWMLPGMSGIELLRSLRKSKKTPVLMLTARDAIRDRVVGLDGGADDYLVKPFNHQELDARIRAIIRRASQCANSRIELGNDLVVDLASKRVFRDSVEISLTAREFGILELLVLRRGSLVSRSTIYEHLFDENDDSLSNLVDVHVSHLRKKLRPDLIETRRGLGYILHA
jgi:two-component system, OmpR family, response regulator